jgi:DNA-binding transcriptional LysR family regulator
VKADFEELNAFLAVARARGFREAARGGNASASTLSDSVSRLETRLGVRLFHRTTRSVTLTDAGALLLDRLTPALEQVEASLDLVNGFRDRPAGTLRLNVPVVAARLVLPPIIPGFLAAYPDIVLEIATEDSFVDVLASGFDAGIRYEERLEQDMIALPIGARVQRLAVAASPAYLDRHGRPGHPRDLLSHTCLRSRFSGGSLVSPWEFERAGEVVKVEPRGRLVTSVAAADLAVEMAVAGVGIVRLFEDWLRPHLASGALEPVLPDWWQSISGPFLYYSGRRLVPSPLRAFLDHIKSSA